MIKDNDYQGYNQNYQSFNDVLVDPIALMAKESEIDLCIEITEPPVILSVDSAPLFFLGDFSLVIGKAKSRKTFLNSLLMAVLAGNTSIGNLQATLPEGKQTVIFFDTEQGEYHAQKAAKRVHKLLGIDSSTNFKVYSLRKYSPSERLKIIEYVLYNKPEVGVVFIDGIRDLVTSINDEEQATKIASKLLKWSSELDIHISCTLHMNKGDNNARGHLGSELLNKSLVTIAVSKCGPEGKYSKVQVTESREKEPAHFMFGIDKDGLPFLVEESNDSKRKSKMNKNISPELFDNEEHLEKLNIVFSKYDELSYMHLVDAVKDEYGIGVNKAKEFVRYLLSERMIRGNKRATSVFYSMV